MILVKEIREKAQKQKLKKKGLLNFGYKTHRFFSAYITYFLLNLFPGIKPNFISFLMIVTGCIGLYLVSLGNFSSQLLGILMIYFSFILDKVDGEIARFKEYITLRGVYLDEIYHIFIPSFLVTFLCFNKLENSTFSGFLFGLLAFIMLNIRYQRKEREFLFLKMFHFIKNNKLKTNKKENFVWYKVFNSFPLKIFSFVERFDLMIFLSLTVVILERYLNLLNIKFYFFFLYLISSLIYLIRLILLNYFGEINKKFNDLFKKYKLWL